MNLIFLGPPGAGKGTQAAAVSGDLKVPHISTGDMFRKAISEGTPTGLKAKSFMDAGQLVPDSVVIDMVKERLSEKDCENGYLLDGFPRTIEQAEALAGFSKVDAVVDIDVPDENLISRLSGRRVCPACHGTFHITTEGLCSRYEFAKAVLEDLGLSASCLIPTYNAADSCRGELRNLMLEMNGLITMPSWKEDLEEFIRTHQSVLMREE